MKYLLYGFSATTNDTFLLRNSYIDGADAFVGTLPQLDGLIAYVTDDSMEET